MARHLYLGQSAFPEELAKALQEFNGRTFLRDINMERTWAKPIYELVVYEPFRVDEVLSQSRKVEIKPLSELNIGGLSSAYNAGYTSELVLTVQALAYHCNIKTLKFKGVSPVICGNQIIAAIPAFKGPFDFQGEYYPRDLIEKESAIEIAILGKRNKILRTDRSIDYGLFQKP